MHVCMYVYKKELVCLPRSATERVNNPRDLYSTVSSTSPCRRHPTEQLTCQAHAVHVKKWWPLYCVKRLYMTYKHTDGLTCIHTYRLFGLMVKASASRAPDAGFGSRQGDFSGSSHRSDLKIGTHVVTLPGVWRYMVSAGFGWPCVSML